MTAPSSTITLEPMDKMGLGLIVLVSVAFGVAIWALWRALVAERRLARLEENVREALGQCQGLSVGALGQGRHLARLDTDLTRLRDRVDQVGNQSGGGEVVFGQAIRMARRGACAEEIMETCGISRMEADLVVTVHYRSDQTAE